MWHEPVANCQAGWAVAAVELRTVSLSNSVAGVKRGFFGLRSLACPVLRFYMSVCSACRQLTDCGSRIERVQAGFEDFKTPKRSIPPRGSWRSPRGRRASWRQAFCALAPIPEAFWD
jgi:hypothetical protein